MGRNVVRFKDSNVCILLNDIGIDKEFNTQFSKVTSEGYELKAVRPFGSFKLLGTGGDTAFEYYFQKIGKSENS